MHICFQAMLGKYPFCAYAKVLFTCLHLDVDEFAALQVDKQPLIMADTPTLPLT